MPMFLSINSKVMHTVNDRSFDNFVILSVRIHPMYCLHRLHAAVEMRHFSRLPAIRTYFNVSWCIHHLFCVILIIWLMVFYCSLTCTWCVSVAPGA